MNIGWIRALKFSEIRYDQWRRSVGSLSPGEQEHLRTRERAYRLLTILRSVIKFPISFINSIIQTVRILDEFDRLHFSPMRKVKRGLDCVIDRQTWLMNGHRIQLGDFVKVSAFSTIMAGEKAKVTIGTNTIIGPGVVIVAFNHGTEPHGVPMRYQDYKDKESNSILIGEDVWLGANVIVLPGTIIGDGSIVGAGTIVKGNIPPGVMVYAEMKDRLQMVPRR